MSQKEFRLSRRDFMKIAGVYGVTSTALAAASLTGVITAPRLAQAANSTYEKRHRKTPFIVLKYGWSDFDLVKCFECRVGYPDFVRDIEERTDGEISVEAYMNNSINNQGNGIAKVQQGIIDMCGNSTQNAAKGGPYYNVLDMATLFPNRAAGYYFFYHPKSEKLLREPIRRLHNVEFLFSQFELRGIALGEKFRDKPSVTSIDELKGLKIRTAGSQLSIITLTLLGMSPVPLAWEETLDALRQGLVDGQETNASSIQFGKMYPVTTQLLETGLSPTCMHTCIGTKSLEKLTGRLQDVFWESVYQTQIMCQLGNEAALANTIGAMPNPQPGTCLGDNKIKFITYDAATHQEIVKRVSPKHHPDEWKTWIERLSEWASVPNVFDEISAITNEVPAGTLAENVEPRRWWRG